MNMIESYERGEIVSALMFFFANGFMLQVTPGAAPILMETGVQFGEGAPDEFGVRPHSHADVRFSEAKVNVSDPFSIVLEGAKTHGPPLHMSPVLLRKVGRFQVRLFSPPAGYREAGYVVAAIGPKEGSEAMTEQEAVEAARSGQKVKVPEHDHWFASDKPLPLSAAIWIFRSLTEENLNATNCNCGSKVVSPSQIGKSMGLSGFDGSDPSDDPDEAFIGVD